MSGRQVYFVHPHCLERLNELGWREGMAEMAVIEHIRAHVTSAVGNPDLSREIDDIGRPTRLVTLASAFPEPMYAIVRANWSTKPGCSPQVVVTLLTAEMVKNNEDFRWNGNRGHVNKGTKPLTSRPFVVLPLKGMTATGEVLGDVAVPKETMRTKLHAILEIVFDNNEVDDDDGNICEGSIIDIVGDFVKLAMEHLADQI